MRRCPLLSVLQDCLRKSTLQPEGSSDRDPPCSCTTHRCATRAPRVVCCLHPAPRATPHADPVADVHSPAASCLLAAKKQSHHCPTTPHLICRQQQAAAQRAGQLTRSSARSHICLAPHMLPTRQIHGCIAQDHAHAAACWPCSPGRLLARHHCTTSPDLIRYHAPSVTPSR